MPLPDSDVLAAYFDQQANNYNALARQSQMWQIGRDVASDNVRRFLPEEEGAHILDAAGGNGWHAMRLAQLGYRVTLVDISETILAIAREEIELVGLEDKIELVRDDIRDLSELDDETFDAAICLGTSLSDCGNPEAALGELARLTKPAGAVTVSVRNKYARLDRGASEERLEASRDFLIHGEGSLSDSVAVRYYSAEEMVAIMSRFGLAARRLVSYPHFFEAATSDRDRVPRELYEQYLDLEMRYAPIPSMLGRGAILDVTALKQ